jgi:hypothetical protein
MQIHDFIWPPDIIDKLATKHNVSTSKINAYAMAG